MKKKEIVKIIALIIACVQLIGCGVSSGVGAPVPAEPGISQELSETAHETAPEEINVIVSMPDQASEYHLESFSDEILPEAHLVRLTSDELEYDVYACMLKDGEVAFYVFAHEEYSGEHGFLRAFLDVNEENSLVATIDTENGIVLMPEVAECELAEAAEYEGVGEAIVYGVDDVDEESEPVARMYYPMLDDGSLMAAAIPVDIQILEDESLAVVYRIDEVHYLN